MENSGLPWACVLGLWYIRDLQVARMYLNSFQWCLHGFLHPFVVGKPRYEYAVFCWVVAESCGEGYIAYCRKHFSCVTYMRLACASVAGGHFFFRARPKLHLVHHICKWRRGVNPSKYSTWMDEDYLKRIGRVLKLVSVLSAQKRILERWLMSIPETLRQHMRWNCAWCVCVCVVLVVDLPTAP